MSYKKYFLMIVYVLLTVSHINAQQTDGISVENSLLWKISGNELIEDSYLFGTIHIIPEDDFFYTESIKSAFELSKKLVMEVDLDIAFSAQLSLMQKMMLPDGKSISSYMTDKEYNKLEVYLKDSIGLSGISIMLIDKIKPMFSFSVILEEKIKNIKVYEMHFMELAKKRKMKVVGLETLEEQVSIIDNIPIESQVKMLLAMTDSKDVVEEYFEMLDVYKKERINELYEYSKEDRELEKYTDDLLVNRNQKWISKLTEQMKESSCFIAVGSGHLAGETGLVNLLRNEGYVLSVVKVFE
ncbi:MAG: hypothetical protein DRJ10_10475 [Bacteroidetes bacterium]|nr:MAG: hypothetical protein DRJ10_10475 [Bacteroidota bacterium]